MKNHVVVVTGALSGLGMALSQRLVAKGARLALWDRNQEALEKFAQNLPGEIFAREVQMTSMESVQKNADEVIQKFGRIDALVNCVGITGKTNMKSHEVPLDDFENVVRLNILACYLPSRAILPQMIQQKYGRILHMASIAGKEGNAGMVAYSTSKAAIIGMTKSQGKEYAEMGITVNAMAPAVIKTAMHDTMPVEQIRYMTEKIPMKRCGTLEEYAAMAEFIISPECSFSTGFVFDLSGGRATY